MKTFLCQVVTDGLPMIAHGRLFPVEAASPFDAAAHAARVERWPAGRDSCEVYVADDSGPRHANGLPLTWHGFRLERPAKPVPALRGEDEIPF